MAWGMASDRKGVQLTCRELEMHNASIEEEIRHGDEGRLRVELDLQRRSWRTWCYAERVG
jgi:hypothetical protein